MVKLRYERRGRCKQCGECCTHEACLHLEFFDGRAQCLIHPGDAKEDTRPDRCGYFPQAPPIMFNNCGYYFVDTWEDNRVVGPREV